MTDMYKNQLINYLTGKLTIQVPNNEPQFTWLTTKENKLYTYITEHTVQPVGVNYSVIKGKDGNGNELDEQILYGIDDYDDSTFMVILDKNNNPIQFINTYYGGTKFGSFDQLIIDDDGKFYGVEYNSSTATRRFVMLNNILVKSKNQSEYKVVLRKSYPLPEILQTVPIKQLIKKPLENRYLFCTTTIDSQTLVNQPTLVELSVNVGIENDWKEYIYSDNSCTLNTVWASWDINNDLKFKIIGIYTNPPMTVGKLYVLSKIGDNITIDKQFDLDNPASSWKQSIILNENTMYYSFCDTDGNGIYNQYIYKIENSLTQIFKSPNTDIAMPGSLIKSDFYSDGYNAYISFNVPNADDTLDYYMGIIYNDELYYFKLEKLEYTTSTSLYATNTFHQFNLYTYYLQLGDKYYQVSSIFNNLNYNGVSYSNLNLLNPHSVILSKSTRQPLFARNLYNKIVSDNITISTVEVPNTLMNGELIEQQELYSQTNIELIESDENITKNIYETLDINFYNTLFMKSINDPSNEIPNLVGAIRVNQSISSINDYYESQATKAKINYNDGTNYIVAIDPSTQITFSGNIATYSFIIYSPTDKDIVNLEIISYDEKTSYVEINGMFERNKYYRITQDVYVE